MLIASRVTELDGTDIIKNSLTFRKEHMVSIESGRTDLADQADDLSGVDFFVHHSGTIRDTDLEDPRDLSHVDTSQMFSYWNIDPDGNVRVDL